MKYNVLGMSLLVLFSANVYATESNVFRESATEINQVFKDSIEELPGVAAISGRSISKVSNIIVNWKIVVSKEYCFPESGQYVLHMNGHLGPTTSVHDYDAGKGDFIDNVAEILCNSVSGK